MQNSTLYPVFRIVSHVVLFLAGASIIYAAVIALKYWSGIGV
jgi:hypothetical protein